MKKYLLAILVVVVIVILVVFSIGGWVERPEPPGADRPRLIVDHDEEVENDPETIIHLRGMEAIRFDNITLSLNRTEEEGSVRNGYSIEYRTNRTQFHLEVNAARQERKYNFNATFEVEPEVPEEDFNEEIIFKITYYDGEVEYLEKEDLPFMQILNLVEEAEET